MRRLLANNLFWLAF